MAKKAAKKTISNVVHHGDCLKVMKTFKANSIDSIVTDPPYGLGFMGKDWDHGIPGVAYWAEMLRVAKPGAMLLAFGGTRTFHRLTCAIEDAGWEIRDCLMWLYGSGFPKSMDISKAIDKAGGGKTQHLEARKEFATEIRRRREAAGVTRKELAAWFPQYSAVTANWERLDDGFRVPSEDAYQLLIDRLHVADNWREMVRAEDLRRRLENNATDRRGDGTVYGLAHAGCAYESTTETAKLWDGWGTALKPAWEPIILAMKPLWTFTANAQEHGVAGLNIDGCRIGDSPGYKYNADRNGTTFHGEQGNRIKRTAEKAGQQFIESTKGRWPANVILDEEAGAILDEQTSHLKGGVAVSRNKKPGADSGNQVYGKRKVDLKDVTYGDSGGASRFFYCTKASKKEKGKYNKHPTVKPLALMEYLCRLTATPTGGIVLDPFAGSGTTLIAARNTGRQFIGIENEAGYISVINKRLATKRKKKVVKV